MPSQSGTVYINNDRSFVLDKKPKEDNFSELDVLAEKSKYVIYETRSVFPYELFPDRIVICLNIVTIVKRSLFTHYEYPMIIENIIGARVNRHLFFASLYLETFGYKETPEPIRHLRIDEARLARRYILALIECKKSHIDLNKYSITELRKKLKEIGKIQEGFSADKYYSRDMSRL